MTTAADTNLVISLWDKDSITLVWPLKTPWTRLSIVAHSLPLTLRVARRKNILRGDYV
jgi:hypothetical protein